MKPEFPQDEGCAADIENSMKALAVLFAGEITRFALEPLGDGPSAFERCLACAAQLPDVAGIAVFAPDRPDEDPLPVPVPPGCTVSLSVHRKETWTTANFFSVLSEVSEDYDQVFMTFADCPYIDPLFSSGLYRKHLRYAAEYSFADGYPYGLSPDILARGIIPVLSRLATGNGQRVTRPVVFDTVKKDINSFDIETDIAPVDLRHLRLELACDTRRNFGICRSLEGIDASNYGTLVAERSSLLRPLPAFYAVQVSGRCPCECGYCPYPAYCRSGKGGSPGIPAVSRGDFLPLADFTRLASAMADFSGDAVVSLSLWGECAYHPEIVALVGAVLAHPGLSVLIETTGIGWSPDRLREISALVASSAPRTNRQQPVTWIVSLDAVSPVCYGDVHGLDSAEAEPVLRSALACTELLASLFPGAVWPQMVRMNGNEAELESFYRFWKEKYGQVIIQKHDHFCRSIEDRRVADLSPLVRHPCWHLKRDMSIMIDGTVPRCREDLYAVLPYGNALIEGLAAIWDRLGTVYRQHTECSYEGICGACDEYYTYNF